MDAFPALLHRFEAKRSLTYSLIRIFLGFALFVRGWIFIRDQEALMALVVDTGLDWLGATFLVHYITLAHLVGGFMLAVGLLTRWAALAQIPILFGAVFFVHWNEGLFAAGQSLELAALVLFLLVVTALAGPGELSIDHYLARKKEKPDAVTAETHFELPPSGIIAPRKGARRQHHPRTLV